MDSEIFGYVFPWIPSIVFGVLFLVSHLIEPRQFRNAIFFFGFIVWTGGMAILWTNHTEFISYCVMFIMIVLPAFAVISLTLNTIVVVRRNGLSAASLLPGAVALSIVLMALCVVLFRKFGVPEFVSYLMALWFQESLWFMFTYLALFLYTWFYRRLPHKRVYDYIIVHGAGLMGTEPTPLLAGRVDKALELWEHQKRAGKFVLSGGQGADEEISEAEAMKRYLLKKGVPEDVLIKEDRSTTTWENLRFSKEIMDERSAGEKYRAAVVTSDYHVFRCAEYAHKLKIPADGVGSHTRSWYWPAAFTREFVAITKAHWWPYAVIFAYWLIVYVPGLL